MHGIVLKDILHHATPRIFFGFKLVPGGRDQLLGLTIKSQSKNQLSTLLLEHGVDAGLLTVLSEKIRSQKLRSLGPATLQATLYVETDNSQIPLELG